MALPGGPADKAGNRLELEWTLHCALAVLVGTATAIRLEPPGEHSIEFRLLGPEDVSVHQVKRASRHGRWTAAELGPVLEGFKTYLVDDHCECVFVSEHSAHPLDELSARARAAASWAEFQRAFASSRGISESLRTLAESWQTSEEGAFHLVARVHFEAASLKTLTHANLQLLRAIYGDHGESAHAVLCRELLDSVHQTLTAESLDAALDKAGIPKRKFELASPIASDFGGPAAAELVGRERAIEQLRSDWRAGTTLVLEGPSGVGKTALCTALAREMGLNRTVWIDGSTLTSDGAIEAIVVSLGSADTAPPSVGGAVSAIEGAKGVVVWDGVDGESPLLSVIEALDSHLSAGRQLVTRNSRPRRVVLSRAIHRRVDPLERTASIALFKKLAGRRPTEAQLTSAMGLPKLIEVAAVLARRSGDEMAELSLHEEGLGVIDVAVARLSTPEREALGRCVVFEVPFRLGEVATEPDAVRAFRGLLDQFLVSPVEKDHYRVHSAIRMAVVDRMSKTERKEAEAWAFGVLAQRTRTTPLLMRALASHAARAGLSAEAKRILLLLLTAEANHGRWAGVEEASSLLEDVVPDEDWSVAFYLRGKALRLCNKLESSLKAYRRGQVGTGEAAMACRGEEAAVLALLGRPDDAIAVYRRLREAKELRWRVLGVVSTSIILARTGRAEQALEEVEELVQQLPSPDGMADDDPRVRELITAHQARAFLLLELGRAQESIPILRMVHGWRYSWGAKEWGADALGWYDFLQICERAERTVGHREGAASAARGMWRYAVVGNRGLIAVAEAVYLWASAERETSEDLLLALQALKNAIEGSAAGRGLVGATGLLAAALWSVGRQEEAMAEIASFDSEYPRGIPIVFTDGDLDGGWFAARHDAGVWFFRLEPGFTIEDVQKLMPEGAERFLAAMQGPWRKE